MTSFVKEKFVFVGNRPHIRLDEEMSQINKEEADNAFKKCKREILDKVLTDNGFYKWKSNAYVRRNDIYLLEYIDLQKERYGSKTFCVNFAIMPLYCGRSYISLHMGYRLGSYIAGQDIWWDYCNEEIAGQSFENVAEAITQFAIPWFSQVSSEEEYQGWLMKKNSQIAREWLEALKIKADDKESLSRSGIERLKLPKKLWI